MKRVVKLLILLCFVLCFGAGHSAKAEEEVVRLTIFSDGSGGDYFGEGTHAFLYFENITSRRQFNILGVVINPGNGITVGTWGNRNCGKGIYINIEAYLIKENGSYAPRVSLSINLTERQLTKAIQMMEKNNKWTKTQNCSWFASKVWNEVCPADMKVSAGSVISTPASLSKSIKKKTGYQTRASVQKAYLHAAEMMRIYADKTKKPVSSSSVKSSSSGSGSSS